MQFPIWTYAGGTGDACRTPSESAAAGPSGEARAKAKGPAASRRPHPSRLRPQDERGRRPVSRNDHADPPARRLRPRRGGAARRLRAPRWSSGRARACPPIPGPGSCRPAASRRSTASAGAPGSTRSTRRRRAARRRHRRRPDWDDEGVEDDRLRLIFTCCHPALSPDAQVALTLREVCGLTTEEIARAFLTTAAHAGPAHRARQGEDPRRAHPLPGAVAGRAAGPARQRAARGLPGVQRGLLGLVGRVADAPRSLGRGDPPGAAAGRAAAGARGDGAAGADAAAGIAARRAHLADGRARSCWTTRTARCGTGSRSRRARRWWSGRWPSRRFGPYTLQAAIAAVHAEAPRPPPRRTGRRSSACTTCWRGPSPRRWSS